ncbi:MAG: PhnD/SsuA/transferrin family substrate-binding protein, partial [Chloroflexota bacterium]
FTSIQSPNSDESCQAISEYVQARLGIETEFIENASWQDRDKMINRGFAQVGWVCGLPYVLKQEAYPDQFELIAAPVMEHQRYQHRPVYYSDVVVRYDSNLQTFGDLKGKRWAYNEPNSQSGYNITRYHLAVLREEIGYFGNVIEAGSHLNAVDMILNGEIDAAAIDSTVLELAYEERPELRQDLRVVDVLGPSPIPPWIINTSVPRDVRDAIKRVFWTMHMTADGQDILSKWQIERLAPVSDADYDPIRRMAKIAEKVRW